MSSTSAPVLLPRICPACQDVVPLAVTTSADTLYLGWICIPCLADDTRNGLLDVIGVHAAREDAEWELVTEEYYSSLEPPGLGLAEALDHEYTTVE